MTRSARGTAYGLSGDPDAPPLVLIHGLGLDRETWRDHVRTFTEDFRVLTYDLFGHGDSDGPPETPSLTTYSEQLAALLDELDIASAHVVGFSLGGMINRRFAADHPDRVESLAILNSPHERSPEDQQAVEQRARDSAKAGPSANIEQTLNRWFTPAFRASHPQRVDEVRRCVTSNDAATYADCRFVLASGVVELIRPDPPIAHRTLVITCEHDSGSTPDMSHAIASEIPGAQLIIIPELQHLGLIERPELFTEPLVTFIRSTP
ncbi:MAG: alpha/beta fold hydrolase [Acidimicrobiales bacterium]